MKLCLSCMEHVGDGGWASEPEGLVAHHFLVSFFLFSFSSSTGVGDQVYLGFSSRPDEFSDIHVGHFGHILALM